MAARMAQTVGLELCPFCQCADDGDAPQLETHDVSGLCISFHFVQCPSCGATGPRCATRREAVIAWSARHIGAAKCDLVGELIEALKPFAHAAFEADGYPDCEAFTLVLRPDDFEGLANGGDDKESLITARQLRAAKALIAKAEGRENSRHNSSHFLSRFS